MATIRVKVEGFDELKRRLRGMNPATQKQILVEGFTKSALAIQANAASKQITGGGRGKAFALPPLPNQLTSRTGTLRRSIGIDKGPLPWAVEVGTDLVYGAVHEFGNRTHPVRAFMAPALEAIRPKIEGYFVSAWKKAAKL